jgi:hypothetical protein
MFIVSLLCDFKLTQVCNIVHTGIDFTQILLLALTMSRIGSKRPFLGYRVGVTNCSFDLDLSDPCDLLAVASRCSSVCGKCTRVSSGVVEM